MSISRIEDDEESIVYTLKGNALVKELETKIPLNKDYVQTASVALEMRISKFWDAFFRDNSDFSYEDFYIQSYEGCKNLQMSKWTTQDIVE